MRAAAAVILAICSTWLFSQSALADKRVALVIGNSAYQNVSRLANPVNDSAAISATFRSAGFDTVELKRDLNVSEMRRALRDFSNNVRDADVAVVYYAGHGIEIDGTNYLIPVDAVLEHDIDAFDEAIPLDRLLTVIEPAKQLRLVILDACRDNPFNKTIKRTIGARAIGRGLARVEPSSPNTLIAFAAKAGSTASDGDGQNSPFTTALVKYLPRPGLDLRKAFGFARDDVLKATNNRQEPFTYGSLGGDDVALVPAATASPAASVADPSAAVRRDYEIALQINEPAIWDSFIRNYPSGFYTDVAKARRDKLNAEISSIASTEKAKAASDEQKRLAVDGAKAAEQVKAAEEAKAAEQARVAAEKKKAAEDAKVAEAERAKAAALAKATEDARLAAERVKKIEEANAEQERIAAEKKKAQEEAKAAEVERAKAAAQAKAEENARIAAAKAKALEDAKANKVAAVVPPIQPPPLAQPISPCNAGAPSLVSLSSRSARPLSATEECGLQTLDVFKECDRCPEMVVVPAGSFTMGSPESELGRGSDEGPRHPVTFGKPFAAGRFAVTFDEWDACVAGGGCNGYKPSDQGWGRGRRPAMNMSWDDAKAYVRWLSKKTGKFYGLLSEAEREYITRAGTTTPFWWGESISTNQANYNGNYTYGSGVRGVYRGQTVLVESFEPNPWGLFQVHGNVWEWVEDCFHSDYFSAPSDGSPLILDTCGKRVLRGASWDRKPTYLRSASRLGWDASVRDNSFGFRVARSLLAPKNP